MVRFGLLLVLVPLFIACSSGTPAAKTVGSEPDEGEGTLDPEVIQRVVRSESQSYRRCYEAGLARNPRLRGKVTTRFTIGRDGKVTGATTSGDIPDKAVMECVADKIRGLTFPEPEGGGVSVSYPLSFQVGAAGFSE